PPDASPAEIAKTTSFQVTLLSISNCIGRIMFGASSDLVVSKLKLDRSSLLLLAEILTVVPLSILGFSSDLSPSLLSFVSVITGWAFGAASALFPPLTADFFGLLHYGAACAFVMVGVPVGILATNFIFGALYDSAVSSGCKGHECYQKPFEVFVALQAMPVVFSLMLFWLRTWRGRRGVGGRKGLWPRFGGRV
ncbi:hypothetical protein HDU76_008348, partial [Blyttiomyces sp. JEL0837]